MVGRTLIASTFETKPTITPIHQFQVGKVSGTCSRVGSGWSGTRSSPLVSRPIRRAHRPCRTHRFQMLGTLASTNMEFPKKEEWDKGGGRQLGLPRWGGERSDFRSIKRAMEIRQWRLGGSNRSTSTRMSSRSPPKKNPIYWSSESRETWAMRTSKASTYSLMVVDWWRSLSWAKGLTDWLSL